MTEDVRHELEYERSVVDREPSILTYEAHGTGGRVAPAAPGEARAALWLVAKYFSGLLGGALLSLLVWVFGWKLLRLPTDKLPLAAIGLVLTGKFVVACALLLSPRSRPAAIGVILSVVPGCLLLLCGLCDHYRPTWHLLG